MISYLKKIAEFLGSIRLAIALLIIITIVSFFGVLIPQDLAAENYLHKWGNFAGTTLLNLGIDHLFKTPWFYLLLLMVSLNILVCSVTRLWRNAKATLKKSFLSSKTDTSRYQNTLSATASLAAAAVKESVLQHLKKRRFTVKEKADGQGWQISAHKGILKDIGSLFFHLGIIALMIGGLVGAKYGYSFTQELKDGQVVPIPDRNFLLRSDWFQLEKNDDGSVKEYRSKLALLNKDSSIIVEKVIEVNQPLSYQNIRFYQSSFGVSGEDIKDIEVAVFGSDSTKPLWTGKAPYNQDFLLPGTDIALNLGTFLPDFSIDMETREATSRSDNPNNPAIKAVLKRGTEILYDHWAFFNFPDQHSKGEPYKIVVSEYSPAYYTGIQVRKNPGVPIIWVGIITMTFGIFALFYIAKRSVWVFIEPKTDKTATVTIAGTSNRTPSDFQKELDSLCASLNITTRQEA